MLRESRESFSFPKGGRRETATKISRVNFWTNYNDVSRGHPKWWFNKGTSPKSPKHSGLGIILICPETCCYFLHPLKINGWNMEIMEVWFRSFSFSKWVLCMFHVNLPGCRVFSLQPSQLDRKYPAFSNYQPFGWKKWRVLFWFEQRSEGHLGFSRCFRCEV